MTKEEIVAMKPGRELDVLVAKEIFGIEVEWDYPPWDINKQLPKLPFRKGEPSTVLGPMAHPVANTVWEYSTDISAANRVVEMLKEKWDCIDLVWDVGAWDIHLENYMAAKEFYLGKESGLTYEKLPEAICKAALLAKT